MAGKLDVLRKRQIAQALVDKCGSRLRTAMAVVDFIFDEIAMSVAKGIKVNIKDFGIFVKAQRKARMGHNPATGEVIKIKASVKPRFTASKALKKAVIEKKYQSHADLAALGGYGAVSAKKPAVAAKPAAKPAPAKKAPAKKKPAARK